MVDVENYVVKYLLLNYLNIVLIPGRVSEQECWNTGKETPENTAEETRLVETLCILVHETWFTAHSTHADTTVSTAITQTLLPFT